MRGFHGRTLGAVGLTWNKKYRAPFDGWRTEASHVPYGDLDAMRDAVTSDTAAVIVEPVQGEGGVHPAPEGYLQGLRDLCDATGAMLIVDEIQTGMGRTGRWFGFEHADIIPDIVALGKGIAGGVPMGAVCWRAAHGQILAGTHGSTFGGNPLACAAAIATIETLRNDDIVSAARDNGRWLVETLQACELPGVRVIRGAGLIVGLECRGRVTPALKGLQARGVLALSAGQNVLRLLPPLVISREDLEIIVQRIEDVFHAEYA